MHFLHLKDTILLHQPTTDNIVNVQIRTLVEYKQISSMRLRPVSLLM